MKKIALALAAFAVVALAAPIASTSAQAETIVIKKTGHHDRGHHYGWRNSHAKKVVVIKERRRHHHWN